MADLFINGETASLSQQSFQHFHGSSVFTTLRSLKGGPLFLEQHWRRVCMHAEFFRYTIPPQNTIFDFLMSYLSSLASDQKIRIIISENDWAVTFEPYQPQVQAIYEGVQVILSRFRVHPDFFWLKTGNSLCYQEALKEAQREGVFEALLLNHEGYIADGSRTGLLMFDFDEENLVAFEGGLMSIIAEQAMEEAKRLGIGIVKKQLKPSDLKGQLLLTNSLMGVIPVGPPRDDFVKHLISTFKNGEKK